MAFIAGGNGRFDVEVYSPSGGCSHHLGSVPSYFPYAPILGIVNGRITLCSCYVDKRCFQYNPALGTWNDYTTMNYYHYGAPGIL